MRHGLTISIAAHAGLLLWGIVGFAAQPFAPPPVDSLPIDIISDKDFSQMMAGAKKAPKAETPKPLVEKVAEAKPAETPEAKVTEKQEIVTASTAPTPPVPEVKAAEPKPAPPPAAAKPEPKEAEKKPVEKKTDPIGEVLKQEKPKKVEPKKAETAPPIPQRKPAQQPQPSFDPNRIAALLDKRDPQRHASTGEAINHTPTLGTARGNAPTLTQTEIDALRAQIQACWNPPAGVTDGRELIVQVRVMLKPDGSLSAAPELLNRGNNPFFQVAAESAMRAVRRCQPYQLPAAKYEVWKDVEVTFDPRDLYRG